jgi:hypothetical protein
MPSPLLNACHAIEISHLSRYVDTSRVLWPALNTVHLFAMVLLVGGIGAFDLRLLNLAWKREPVSHLAERLLPSTWVAFSVMILTGGLLFISEPQTKYCFNPAFQTKMVLMLLAGINMSVFHFTIYRNVSKWDQASSTPLWAKLVGSFSVILWAGVVIAGRWIGFAV